MSFSTAVASGVAGGARAELALAPVDGREAVTSHDGTANMAHRMISPQLLAGLDADRGRVQVSINDPRNEAGGRSAYARVRSEPETLTILL